MPAVVELPAAQDGSTRGRFVPALALVIVAAAVTTVLWWVVGHRSAPAQVLGPRMGGFSFAADPVPLRTSTLQIGFMAPYGGQEDPETLTFRSARVHFERNTADAVATVSVCLPWGSLNGGIGGGGAAHAPTLERFCREARPVVPGTTLQWGTESMEGEFLVLTVRPTRPGVATVDSISLAYAHDDAHGGRSTTEHLEGQRFVVRAR